MKIITYTADADEDVPTSAQSVAYIHLPKTGFLPVVFRGETSRDARAKAQAHWDNAKGDPIKAADPKKRKPGDKDEDEAQPASVIEEAF